MPNKKRRRSLRRCRTTHLVIFDTELEAKIVLAHRIKRDKGEIRYFHCGDHYHLTSQPMAFSE